MKADACSRSLGLLIVAACAISGASPVCAGFTPFEGPGSFNAWSASSGPFTTIGFTEFPQGTLITSQYEEEGILFQSSDADVVGFSSSYTIDGVGINGLLEVEMSFSKPIFSFGMHHPGARYVFAYSGGTLLWTSPELGASGIGHFSGFTSTAAVDRVLVISASTAPNPPTFIDNVYFSTIPGPSGLAVLMAAAAGSRRRRR